MSDNIAIEKLKLDIERINAFITRIDQELFCFMAEFSELKNGYVEIANRQTSALNSRLESFDKDTKELRAFSKHIMDFFNPNIKAQAEILRLQSELDKITNSYSELKNSLSGLVTGKAKK